MQDDQQKQEGIQSDQQQNPDQSGGILNQTFGEVLQNKEAQDRIMKAMHIGPEQFQQLLKSTEGNPLTNMTVGQMFKSGFVQKAVQAQKEGTLAGTQEPEETQGPPLRQDFAGQVEQVGQIDGQVNQQEEQKLDPEQFQQLVASGNAQVLETDEMGNPTKIAVAQQPQKESFWDFFKGTIKDLIRGKS